MKNVILKHLQKMEFVCGLKQFKEYSKEDALNLLSALEALFLSYSWINDSRIDYILKNGMLGEYGEFYHINEKTVNNWIKQYFQHHQSQIVMENLQNNSKNSISEKTDEEIQYWIEIGKQNFRECFSEAKKTGSVKHLAEWGVYWFDKMKEKGILKPWIYPVEELEDETRRELRLTSRYVEEISVSAKTKNKIWRLFIQDCIKDNLDLTKFI